MRGKAAEREMVFLKARPALGRSMGQNWAADEEQDGCVSNSV